MIIRNDLSLIDSITEFLRANLFVNSPSELSRRMGRSRNYLASLSSMEKKPSDETLKRLAEYLSECHNETGDVELQHYLKHYIRQIDEVLA